MPRFYVGLCFARSYAVNCRFLIVHTSCGTTIIVVWCRFVDMHTTWCPSLGLSALSHKFVLVLVWSCGVSLLQYEHFILFVELWLVTCRILYSLTVSLLFASHLNWTLFLNPTFIHSCGACVADRSARDCPIGKPATPSVGRSGKLRGRGTARSL